MFTWFKRRKETDTVKSAIELAGKLLSIQLAPSYSHINDAFGAIMSNKMAAGYIFGFHDGLLQWLNLREDKERASTLIKDSYRSLFGEWGGTALYSMSLNFQHDPDFVTGRMNGGNELGEYVHKKIPPLGLGRILILGASA